MSNLKTEGTVAALWDFFGKIARHGTLFIVTVVLARLLDPSDFGLVAMIMVIVMLAFTFTDVGLSSALIQRRRVLPVHYNSAFYFNIFLGSTLTLVTFFSANWISEFYENERLVLITQVMSLLFLISSFSGLQITKLRKELKYATLAKAEVGAAVISGGFSIALAYYGAGVWSLVAQAMSRGVLHNLFLWKMSGWTPSFSFSFKALKQLWGFGFRMFLSEGLIAIFARLDIIVIGKLFAPATLGFFDQAKRLLQLIITYASGSIMSVMFPVLSKVQNDLPRFQNIVIKTLGIISFAVFLLLGTMYLVSEELIVLLFTEKWLPSVDYFKLLILSGFNIPVSALLANILTSRGNSKAFLRVVIYRNILVAINLYIGFQWGMEGYLYGLFLVSILAVMLTIKFASDEIKLPFYMFARPVVVQMVIAVISVWIVILFTEAIETYNIVLILLKSTAFFIIYFLISGLLKTSSYQYVAEQIEPIIKRKLRRNNK